MPSKPALTHFLCLPLVTAASRPQLSESLGQFRADVTNYAGFRVPDEAVRPVGTLHLTLGVMSLAQSEKLDRAVALLKALRPAEILSGIRPASMPGLAVDSATTATAAESAGKKGRLSVTLRGLHSMQRDSSRASVLYAPPVDREGVLQQFCEKVRSVFLEAGLVVDESRPLLLHATIVNTTYVKGRGKGRRGDKLTLNARGIIDRYEDEVWMDNVQIESIVICKMGAKDVVVNGAVVDQAYQAVAEVDI